ncbi:putative MscS family protein YhdY [Lentibacillus sp. JNUCC-1]|uniref:mechanosensitive ion channel family protein n=1 Tax=Lentibacillus sp. JNUCC-1 TaxID=2654513 RepID=UPI0012E8C25F|nr:mechanosensitive ion channel family protein [Lentibacillus sp. JNUCC-1]MUV37577.1 putative MscS family protein YhdY [Lentibacillus sp. JNUCC-1]
MDWFDWEYITSTKHLIRLGIAVGIILLFSLFRKIFTKYIFALLLKVVRKSKHPLLPNVLLAFEKPVRALFVIIGFYVALLSYAHNSFIVSNSMKALFQALIVVIVVWGIFNLSSSSSMMFRRINERTSIKIDEIMIPFLSRAIQFIVLAIGLTVVLQVFGYEISGLVAGLGIGGLAFSLAAKDALANLFGGVIIITEKPFTIDDWIMTPTVEGTVEDITFRSTKVRTFSQGLVTVPNATLSNEAITNWTKMGKREIFTKIKLRYETPREKVKKVVERFDHLLRNHEDVHQEYIVVSFDELDVYGYDVMLYYFTKTTSWDAYLAVKQDVNLSMMGILEEEGVSIAIPSQHLYVNQTDQQDVMLHDQRSHQASEKDFT